MPVPVIIDAIRTPIGALGGALAAVRPDDLAALVIKTIVERSQLDPALVEEVYLGCANQAGEDNRNVARMALLLAGLPVSVAGVTIRQPRIGDVMSLCMRFMVMKATGVRGFRPGKRRGSISRLSHSRRKSMRERSARRFRWSESISLGS